MVTLVPFAIIINPVSFVFGCVTLFNRCWRRARKSGQADVETPILRFPDAYDSLATSSVP